MDLKQFFEVELNQKLESHPDLLSDSQNSFELEIGSECWHIDFAKQRRIVFGAHPQPDCRIRMKTEQFEKLLKGQLNVPLALAMRKIRVEGNLKLLSSLTGLFR